MSQSAIRSILMVKLATWAAAQNPVVQIARENVVFPNKPDIFIEALIVPANTTNPTVDGSRFRETGEFIINIWTVTNIGTKAAEDILSSLSSYFPVVPKTLLPLSIETTLSARKAILDDSGYRIVPTSLSYRYES